MDIRGSSAIVTGGASGLGAATVRRLVADGARVVVLDRSGPDPGLARSGVSHVAGDVADDDVVEAAIATATELGPLKVLVNCAGIGSADRTVARRPQGWEAHDLDRFRRVLEVNLVGSFNCLRLVARRIAADGAEPFGGVVVNTASIAAYEGQVGQIAYAVSKAGLVGMTLAAARDLASVGVRVNTIAPGLMATPILDTIDESVRRGLIDDVVYPSRMGSPDEFAALVAAIVDNDYLNGETIRLDGASRMPPRSGRRPDR